MKTEQGFTLIELVVACTLLMILSTVATTTAENFVQAVKQLQANNQTQSYQIQMYSLKYTLAQAQLAYAKDIATGVVTDPNAISRWNLLVQENDSADLIPTLAPYFQMTPAITDFASLLQRVGMYDQNNDANNPTIQLVQLNASSTSPPTLATVPITTLPTVSWHGNTF